MRRDGVRYYRWQAERCRELAQRQLITDVKAQLINVARDYDKLAENAEAEGSSARVGPAGVDS